jgi:hypothetical protein
MCLDQDDQDMFNKRLQRIERCLSDISWFMTPCAPLEKKLMKLIQNGTPVWRCSTDQSKLTVQVGDFHITLALNTKTGTSTEVVIGKTYPVGTGYQRLPAIQLPLAVWFMAYDRAMKDRDEDTLSNVLDKFTTGD